MDTAAKKAHIARNHSKSLIQNAIQKFFEEISCLDIPAPMSESTYEPDSPAAKLHCAIAASLGAFCMGMWKEFGREYAFGPGSSKTLYNVKTDGLSLAVLFEKLYAVAISVDQTWATFQVIERTTGLPQAASNPGQRLQGAIRKIEKQVVGWDLKANTMKHISLLNPLGVNRERIKGAITELTNSLQYNPTWLAILRPCPMFLMKLRNSGDTSALGPAHARLDLMAKEYERCRLFAFLNGAISDVDISEYPFDI